MLASSSPRRREILEHLNLSCEILVGPAIELPAEGTAPELLVCRNASSKVEGVSPAVSAPHVLIISADTVVVLDGLVMGKPETPFQARQMLEKLSGRTHEVFTGVSVRSGPSGPQETGYERTEVTFRDLSSEEIAGYVETGEPLDKAGAYGIQGIGAFLVRKISGCYYNVVGLPVVKLAELCAALGVDLFALAARQRKQGPCSFSS